MRPQDSERRRTLGEYARRVVDGRSADCVAEAIGEHLGAVISDRRAVALRPVQRADVPMILGWRNEPEVRAGMFDDRVIAAEEHSRFWSRRLEAGALAFVIEADGEACGLVRLDLTAEDAEVDIFIPASRQGRGYGTAALKAAATEARALGVRRLVARIKPDNVRSRRAFEKSGFRLAGDIWQMDLE